MAKTTPTDPRRSSPRLECERRRTDDGRMLLDAIDSPYGQHRLRTFSDVGELLDSVGIDAAELWMKKQTRSWCLAGFPDAAAAADAIRAGRPQPEYLTAYNAVRESVSAALDQTGIAGKLADLRPRRAWTDDGEGDPDVGRILANDPFCTRTRRRVRVPNRTVTVALPISYSGNCSAASIAGSVARNVALAEAIADRGYSVRVVAVYSGAQHSHYQPARTTAAAGLKEKKSPRWNGGDPASPQPCHLTAAVVGLKDYGEQMDPERLLAAAHQATARVFAYRRVGWDCGALPTGEDVDRDGANGIARVPPEATDYAERLAQYRVMFGLDDLLSYDPRPELNMAEFLVHLAGYVDAHLASSGVTA